MKTTKISYETTARTIGGEPSHRTELVTIDGGPDVDASFDGSTKTLLLRGPKINLMVYDVVWFWVENHEVPA